ncbi:MAG: hypothetical protein KC516_03270 [Nanoarchaeota archaeon]|nr:hypothetical protein [Nanoarchaeota archaeon]
MKKVKVNDKMQKGYSYSLTESIGRNFSNGFKPELTPKEMLELGVFGGIYMRDCVKEFPKSWFSRAKFAPKNVQKHLPELNFFGVNASMPLSYWKKKGWIHKDDPRGWFQWYCRYYMGRRHEDDERQIRRWKAFRRHLTQVKNNCKKKNLDCRRKQRQALLNWAYDSRKV